MQDARCKMQDARCKIEDGGWKMEGTYNLPGAEYEKLGIFAKRSKYLTF